MTTFYWLLHKVTLKMNCVHPWRLHELNKSLHPLYKMFSTLIDGISLIENPTTWPRSTSTQMWQQASMKLCCTNQLKAVGRAIKSYRENNPAIIPYLETTSDRFVLVDQLSQAKTNFMNLPMIAATVGKAWKRSKNMDSENFFIKCALKTLVPIQFLSLLSYSIRQIKNDECELLSWTT